MSYSEELSLSYFDMNMVVYDELHTSIYKSPKNNNILAIPRTQSTSFALQTI